MTAHEQNWYVHKYQIWLEYGGPEEGGWNYEQGAVEDHNVFATHDEDAAFACCRLFNAQERKRREKEEMYPMHGVFSHQCTYYLYDVSNDSKATRFPRERPHYE